MSAHENGDTKTRSLGALASDAAMGDLTAVGIVEADIKRDIGALEIIALGFNICNSWAGIAGSFVIAITLGGPVSLIYGIVLTSFVYLCSALTLSELASVYPTAGGQYHFTSILAPERLNRSLSYVCGLISVFSWIAINASVAIIPAQQILAIVIRHNNSYAPEDWHYFLIYQVINLAILLYNIFALKRTSWIHDIGFGLTIVSFLIILITNLSMASPKQPTQFVWTTFLNESGWADGICFLTSLTSPGFMYAGLDAALHVAEECKNPTRTVPRALMAAVTIGFCTAFPFTIAILYCMKDLLAIVQSPTGFPIYELYEQATNDAAATVFMGLGIAISFFVLNAVQQTSSRLTWSFARDNGFVFSKFIQRIHPHLEVPIYALVLNWAITLICGCIFLASTTAFNALIGSAVLLQQLSFLFPSALLLYRRRSAEFLPANRSFRLPDWLGWIANSAVVLYAIVTGVFFMFPVVLPVTPSNMNYSCVILGICLLFGAINWLIHGRRHYRGPRIELQ